MPGQRQKTSASPIGKRARSIVKLCDREALTSGPRELPPAKTVTDFVLWWPFLISMPASESAAPHAACLPVAEYEFFEPAEPPLPEIDAQLEP